MMIDQTDIFRSPGEISLARWLLLDLSDDFTGKVARFRQLEDLCAALGEAGTFMPGGEVVSNAWLEARSSFVYGNYLATVMLCQALAEHILASHLFILHLDANSKKRPAFRETLDRCLAEGVVSKEDAVDFRKLMDLRNPLSHYRGIDDPTNLTRRMLDTQIPVTEHLFSDASFAISVAVKLLALPAFRLDVR